MTSAAVALPPRKPYRSAKMTRTPALAAPHAMLTASFLVVPGLLRGTLNVSTHNDWMIYLPVLVVSVAAMLPAIVAAEKYRRMKGVFVTAVAALVVSQAMLYLGAGNLYALLAALIVFFSAFNVMEAALPSLITKVAPPDAKGTAMGLMPVRKRSPWRQPRASP